MLYRSFWDFVRRSGLARHLRDRRGTAAIEFAVLVPFMLAIWLGGLDVEHKVNAATKIGEAARTLADLTSQEPTAQSVPASDISSFLVAASAIASPFTGSLTLTVSAIDLKLKNGTCCAATVNWSVTQGGSQRPCNVTLTQNQPHDTWAPNTIPASIATQGVVVANGLSNYATSVIVVDVGYTYNAITPAIATMVSGPISRHAYAIPRTAGQVTLSGTSGLSANQTGTVCSQS